MAGHSDWRIYERLLGQARPYWPHLAGVFVLRLLSAPLALLTPLPLKIAIDNIIGAHPNACEAAQLTAPSAQSNGSAALVATAGLPCFLRC